jgi:hypothetical protein
MFSNLFKSSSLTLSAISWRDLFRTCSGLAQGVWLGLVRHFQEGLVQKLGQGFFPGLVCLVQEGPVRNFLKKMCLTVTAFFGSSSFSLRAFLICAGYPSGRLRLQAIRNGGGPDLRG